MVGTQAVDLKAARRPSWRDAPIIRPAGKESWRGAPLIDPRPVGRAELPAADAQYGPSTGEEFVRGLRIGTQGVGRGVAGVVGAPVDIASLLLNAGSWAAERLVNVLPGIDGVETPRFNNPVGGSEYISDAAAGIVRALGGKDAIIPESEMTPDERKLKLINQLATEGAVGGGLTARAANVAKGSSVMADAVPDVLKAPYRTSGSVGRVVAGDTAAGAGSGVALGTYREDVPDQTKEALGPVGEFVAALAGGVGGAGLLRTPGAARDVAGALDARRPVATENIPLDPETALPTSRGVRDQAARSMQEQATNPATAARTIDETAATIGDGAHPTAGVMSNDPGLLTAERRLRSGEMAPQFITRDRAVMDSVSDRVSGLRPEGADPKAARTKADTLIGAAQTQTGRALANVSARKSAAAQRAEELAAEVKLGRSADQASRDLDRVLVEKTYLPARIRKNELYDAAAGDPNVVVGTENVSAAAKAKSGEISKQNPVLRDAESKRVSDAFAYRPGEKPPKGSTEVATGGDPNPRIVRPLGDVMADRQALSTRESEARSRGDFGKADTMRTLRKGVNEDVKSAAESGVPGTEKLAAADSNYRKKFAPYFRDGNTAPEFFKKVDKDPSRASTPPEATAQKFLTAGPTSRAAAEDVAKILEISPSRAEGVSAAEDYVLADAVSKGVLQNGMISETRLAKFMSQREGLFSQLPSVRARFNDLLAKVRSGNAETSRLSFELAEAQKAAKLTQKQIDQGVLKLVADFEPGKAVAKVFGRPDPAAAMDEVVTSLKGNEQALRGWKAAVADHLSDKVTTASKAGASEGHDTISLPALTKVFRDNVDTLAKVFTPDEMASLQQAHKRLEAMSRRGAQASTGSSTAENLGGVQGFIRAFAQPIGTAVAITKGVLLGGSVERRTKMLADLFPGNNAAAQKLIARAMFDPAIAKHLLEMPVAEKQMTSWNKKLNQLIAVDEAGSGGGDENGQ